MNQSVAKTTDGAPPHRTEALRAPTTDYASDGLRLSGITLSEVDLERTVAEFDRALEIARPLLEYPLPDGLDQAGIYRP